MLKDFFAAASMAQFNPQLAAPECSVASWTFETQFLVTQILPLVFVFVLLVLLAADAIRVRAVAGREASLLPTCALVYASHPPPPSPYLGAVDT